MSHMDDKSTIILLIDWGICEWKNYFIFKFTRDDLQFRVDVFFLRLRGPIKWLFYQKQFHHDKFIIWLDIFSTIWHQIYKHIGVICQIYRVGRVGDRSSSHDPDKHTTINWQGIDNW